MPESIAVTGNSIGVGASKSILRNFGAVSGTVAENFERHSITAAFTPTSGTVYVSAIGLAAGQVVTNISMLSAVGITGPTHYQFGLYSSAAGVATSLVASSADQTSTAWLTNTVKTIAMSSAYTVPTTGLYFMAFFYTGSALTLRAAGTTDQVSIVITPSAIASSDAGVTALQSTAGAQTGVSSCPYMWIT